MVSKFSPCEKLTLAPSFALTFAADMAPAGLLQQRHARTTDQHGCAGVKLSGA